MEPAEIITAAPEAVKKLIDAVSGVIGNALAPWQTRRLADAKVYEINQMADAMRNNSDIPIRYHSTDLDMDTTDFKALAERTSRRLAFQEISKQRNIESVVAKACEELKDKKEVSSEPVSPDWMIRFFNSVEDISSEQMQEIWAKILAGEIIKPNTFSLRTLECLRNLTQKEAQLFERIATQALHAGNSSFILWDEKLNERYGVIFADILKLEECGLMHSDTLALSPVVKGGHRWAVYNSAYICFGVNKGEAAQRLSVSVYAFTESGGQLLKVVTDAGDEKAFREYAQKIQAQNKSFSFTMHKVEKRKESGTITYNTADLL